MGANVVSGYKQRLKGIQAYWRLCAFVGACVFVTDVRGQQHLYQFWQISIEQGLANNIVNEITQDHTGYTWIATSGGIQKFDGVNFVTFTTANSNLPSNDIQHLYCDDANILWFITPKGLCRYDGLLNDIIPVVTEGNFTNAFFFQDTENRVWINANGKFFKLDGFKSTWTIAEPLWAKIKTTPRLIVASGTSNKTWLATQSDLFCYDHTKQSLDNLLPTGNFRDFMAGETVKEITALQVVNGNYLLLAVSSATGKSYSFQLDIAENKWHNLEGQGKLPIRKFLTTREGATWALGENIMRAADHKWDDVSPVQEEYRLRFKSKDIFRTMSENRDGSLWIGTNNGIFIFTPQAQQFSYFANPFSTISPDPGSQERKGNIKITALNDSLLLLSRPTSTPIVTNANFQPVHAFTKLLSPIKQVTAVHKDINGVIWIASKYQLRQVDFTRHSSATLPLPKGVIISQMISDNNSGDIWLITNDGSILKLGANTEQFVHIAELSKHREFINGSVADAIFSGHGLTTLWLTFAHQVVRFETTDGDLQFFDLPRGVSTNQAADYDKEKLILATDEGLYFFSKESGNFSPVYFGKEQFNHAVAGVSIDIQKNIWASTKGNGLFRISASGKEARQYGSNEGVVYRGFSAATNIPVHVNRTAILTHDGILVFDPLHTPGPLFNPRVQITSFIVNEKEKLNALTDESAELKWNENNVRIGFSSMSYLYNDQTAFSFKLEGHDGEWTKAMKPEIVKYSNLSAGDYTFRVRCMATSGEVMSDETTLAFSIVAPFWDTLAFKLVIVTSIALGIFLVYYVRHVRRKNIQEIKNNISRDLHDHIGSSLSSISLMLNVAETKMQSNPQQSSALLKKIENTAQLTQENLHDIVWSIQNEKNSMGDIVDRMEEFYVSLFEGQAARIEFTVDPDVRDLNLDLQKRYNLYLLFKEIVNNGAKYSKATRVTTALRKKGNTVTLSYDDNGVGFCTDPAPEGNGLSNMKKRATLLGGSIDIQSTPGHGTQIELTFVK